MSMKLLQGILTCVLAAATISETCNTLSTLSSKSKFNSDKNRLDGLEERMRKLHDYDMGMQRGEVLVNPHTNYTLYSHNAHQVHRPRSWQQYLETPEYNYPMQTSVQYIPTPQVHQGQMVFQKPINNYSGDVQTVTMNTNDFCNILLQAYTQGLKLGLNNQSQQYLSNTSL